MKEREVIASRERSETLRVKRKFEGRGGAEMTQRDRDDSILLSELKATMERTPLTPRCIAHRCALRIEAPMNDAKPMSSVGHINLKERSLKHRASRPRCRRAGREAPPSRADEREVTQEERTAWARCFAAPTVRKGLRERDNTAKP